MDKELKGLVGEIIAVIILMVIAIPICVKASSDYQTKKDKMIIGNHASVDISNRGEIKKVTVNSDNNKDISVYLILKISKFDDEYIVYLDDQIFDLKDLEYTEDNDNYYYNLGLYSIKEKRTFVFRITVKDKSYYNETISYSFYTKGLFEWKKIIQNTYLMTMDMEY